MNAPRTAARLWRLHQLRDALGVAMERLARVSDQCAALENAEAEGSISAEGQAKGGQLGSEQRALRWELHRLRLELAVLRGERAAVSEAADAAGERPLSRLRGVAVPD